MKKIFLLAGLLIAAFYAGMKYRHLSMKIPAWIWVAERILETIRFAW